MNRHNNSRIDISLLATSDIKGAESLSTDERTELLRLLKYSYPDFGYNHVFDNYACYKQLYVFRLRINKTLVASRQFLIVSELSKMPSWANEINNVLQTQRFAIGSRAIVHPFLRGHGLGSYLVNRINEEVFQNHDAEAILGSSTSLDAISLYIKRGAKLWKEDIQKLANSSQMHVPNTAFEKIFDINNRPKKRISSPLRYVYRNNKFENNEYNKIEHYLYPANIHSGENVLIR